VPPIAFVVRAARQIALLIGARDSRRSQSSAVLPHTPCERRLRRKLLKELVVRECLDESWGGGCS
jgi:hypothetical protein